MGVFKRFMESLLNYNREGSQSHDIWNVIDAAETANRNRIWYRGEPSELEDFYKSDETGRNTQCFWRSSPYIGIRKIHSGVPALMVNTISNIVVRDLDGIVLNDESSQETWDKIEKDSNLKETLFKAVAECLAIGDGAFKISYDRNITKYPIIEWRAGDSVDYVYKRGHLMEVEFKTRYKNDSGVYVLHEHYGKGYITYELTDVYNDHTFPLSKTEETVNLKNVLFTDENGDPLDTIMAVPFKIYKSAKYENRGASVFERKYTVFDALDEILSQWADAVRASRPSIYIPESQIPRDPRNGRMMKVNDFDNRFIATPADIAENAENRKEVIQPSIPSDQYLQSYMTFLDLAIEGVVSPSTLGIDTKKLDNAEAQREKEKVTLYTRNRVIEALTSMLENLVNVVLSSYRIFEGLPLKEESESVTVKFGEYANPSFEAVVDTIAKAKTSAIMSNTMVVNQLYGDSLSEEEKQAEIERLEKAEEFEEPSIGSFDSERLEP